MKLSANGVILTPMEGKNSKELLYGEDLFDVSILTPQILSTIKHSSPEIMIRDLAEIRDSILDCGIDAEKFSIKDAQIHGKSAVESKILSHVPAAEDYQDILKKIQSIKYEVKEKKENFARKLLLLIGVLSS